LTTMPQRTSMTVVKDPHNLRFPSRARLQLKNKLTSKGPDHVIKRAGWSFA
jgi:hypothetical protein